MQLKEQLKRMGFPVPSDKKLKIFRGRIYKMLNREKQETVLTGDMDEEAVMQEWDTPFSPQYTFESFMHGGPKYLRTLNAKTERMLKAPDGSTTEQYKNKQRERVYDDMHRWGILVGLEQDTILQAQMLFHRVRVCAARLHSPLTVGIVCLMIMDEQLRSTQETLTFPPKNIPMRYGQTSRSKWIQTLEADTLSRYGGCDTPSCGGER